MAKEYFTTLIAQACDADKRQENTFPAEMITVGYAVRLWEKRLLMEEEDE